MGDILGGGLILTLGSFMITLAGLDTTSAYGGIGSSRAVMVAILAEPTLILVFVGITLLAKAMLPFVVNHLLVAATRGLLEPDAPVPGRGLLRAAAGGDRPAADPLQHAYRSLHDRGGAHPRIFRAAAGAAALGLDDEAVHPLHDLLQRPAAAMGPVLPGHRARRARQRHRPDAEIPAGRPAPSCWWIPPSRACASTATRSRSRPRSCSPSSPSSARNWVKPCWQHISPRWPRRCSA